MARRLRLTKPDPDRRHPHPSEEGATHTLRRHFAVLKALLVVLFIGTALWCVTLAALMVTLRFGLGIHLYDKGILGLFLMVVSIYVARLGVKAILPISY